jgi:hypothetical protein
MVLGQIIVQTAAMSPPGQKNQMALNNFMIPKKESFSLGMLMVTLYPLKNDSDYGTSLVFSSKDMYLKHIGQTVCLIDLIWNRVPNFHRTFD